MRLANAPDRFGLVSRVLHRGMAAGIPGSLGLGPAPSRMQPGLATIWLYGLHKSLGMALLVLVLARIARHRASPPPRPLPAPRLWQDRLARAVHGALCALRVAVPRSGWVMASASGIDTVVWGGLTLPAIAPPSVAVEDAAAAFRRRLTRAPMALVALHVAGALARAWAGDATLRRMLTGR
jgi:cytochrome b561